jgi:predicted secreted protein
MRIDGWTAAGLALAAAWIAGAAATARAQGEDVRDRVSFSVSREADVDNDRATAVMTATAEDEEPARVASQVNRAMAAALERARAVPAVRAHSGGYQTHPVQYEGKIRRWRARQELVLESGELDALTALVGELQEHLELARIGFSVSPERREATEEALIGEALAAFRARAERVREALGAGGYEIVEVHLDTGSFGPPPVAERAMLRSSADAASPAFEAGTSRIRVGASGTIQLE